MFISGSYTRDKAPVSLNNKNIDDDHLHPQVAQSQPQPSGGVLPSEASPQEGGGGGPS